jgi:hypothetical protein
MVKAERKPEDGVWLKLPGYEVVPLNTQLDGHVKQLTRAIHQGVRAHPDLARQDFYDVEIENGWDYIHVRTLTQKVYLVAHFASRFSSSSSNGISSGDEEMDTKQASALNVSDREEDSSTPNVPQTGQIDLLAIILSRAFHEQPTFTYLIPDERERRAVLPWFFRSLAIRASQFCGEIYTTETVQGGALWISPGRAHTFGRVLRTGMLTAPFRLGKASFRRCLSLKARLEEVHRRVASGPHWYLMALGVESADKDNIIRAALIDPMLSRADSDGLPCYLESFNPADLPFYKSRGFRIEGAGRIAGGGPNFWALLRTPRSLEHVVGALG